MSEFITPALIGLFSTLVTLFLTPRLQHYFWGYQRLSELRLSILREINDLTADFLNNYMNNSSYQPLPSFFKTLTVLAANIRVLYSAQSFTHFKALEIMIGPNLGPSGGSVEQFIEKRELLLKALYKEAVVAKLL
jgi:hypothetical protein